MIRIIKERESQIENVIADVMTQAYRAVAEKYKDDLSRPGPETVFLEDDKCQQVSEEVFGILRKKYFIPVEYVYLKDKKLFLEYGGRHHVYLLVDNRYLLDGTWQSFLGSSRKNKPYLFLKIRNLEQDLRESDVPSELWPIWLNYKNGLKNERAA